MSKDGKVIGPQSGSVAFRVCFFLGCNPTLELTTGEIADMFCFGESNQVKYSLRSAVETGWLDREQHGAVGVYRVGPNLLKTLVLGWNAKRVPRRVAAHA